MILQKRTNNPMAHINNNLRYLMNVTGNADTFAKMFKEQGATKYTVYSYTREQGPTKPKQKLVAAISEQFGIPIDTLYEKDLKETGWKYTPTKLPVPAGKFIGGKDGFTYRMYVIIEMLQAKYLHASLQEFVKSLDKYKKSYTTFSNMRQAIQKATGDIMQDIKNRYPEVNMNFVFDKKETEVFLTKKEPVKSREEMRKQIMDEVNKRLEQFEKGE